MMKKELFKIFVMFAAITATFISCSDDDTITKSTLDTTTISEGAKTVSSLAFSWTPVNGATQYAYELKNTDDEIVLGGVTSATSLVATGLKERTTYTLSVWAYAALSGDKTTSPIAVITATTNEVTQLDTPQAEATQGDGGITISWPAVAHADHYLVEYNTGTEDMVEETYENSITLRNLSIGEHRVGITAISTDENYSNSMVFEMTVVRSKTEIWRVDCKYTSEALNQSFDCQVVAYDDGSYDIEGIYGSDDRIGFVVGENKALVITNAYSVQSPYTYIKAGDYVICAYMVDGYHSAEVSPDNGYVWFYCYLYDSNSNYLGCGYDEIQWSSDSESMDNLLGTYTETSTCYDFTVDWTNWTLVNEQQAEVTIERHDDNSVQINNFYNSGSVLYGKVDMEARTITIDNTQLFADYYTFADYDNASQMVVATFDENYTITLSNWTLWYGGYQYIYAGASTTLVKRNV